MSLQRSLDLARRQLEGLGCCRYEWQWLAPRELDLRPGPIRRGDVDALLSERNFRWLRRQNAMGYGIYVRPAPLDAGMCEALAFVDDLDADAVRRVATNGHIWAALIESSPGRYQGWIRLSEHPLPRAVVTAAAKALAARYGGDPSSADWRHYGRLAGFTNTKPARRTERGPPFCLLREANIGVAEAARVLLSEVVADVDLSPRRAAAAARARVSFTTPLAIEMSDDALVFQRLRESGRRAKRQVDRSNSGLDQYAAVYAIARLGWDKSRVAAAMLCGGSPDLHRRHRDGEDYVRRTVSEAADWVECHGSARPWNT